MGGWAMDNRDFAGKMAVYLLISGYCIIGGFFLFGCASRGFQKGYDDSVKYARGENVRQGYCQGYRKGWDTYVLERGRAERWRKGKVK
jgi:hypothetical protein